MCPPLDAFGHHKRVRFQVGRRLFAVESAVRISREAGARVMVNVFVRDLIKSNTYSKTS